MVYAEKFVLFVITAVLGTNLTSALLERGWGTDQWWTLGITVLGAALVYVKQNTPASPEAKYIIALFVPALLVLQAAISDRRITPDEVAPIIIALIGAFQTKAGGTLGEKPAALAGRVE